jgi:hypothetical protein
MHLLEPRHLGVPSSASKTIHVSMVCLAQTVYVSCTDTNTVSKQTKTRFHITHIALEFHRVRPKWFLSLGYFGRKPCTYLSSRLALSPNKPKRASTESRHLDVPSGASKMFSKPMVHMTQTMHLSYVKISTINKQTESTFHLSLVT